MTSPMQHCCEHAMIRSTNRSRSKPKPIPTASEVTTYDYVWQLKKSVWDRTRMRRRK